MIQLLIGILVFSIHLPNETRLLEGMVIDSKTSEPIAFANIGILNAEVGTLSNEDGSFSIRIPAKYEKQDLIFSSIGHSQRSFPVDKIDFSLPLNVSLDERITELEEITISAKRRKKQKATFGNGKSLLPKGRILLSKEYAGSAFALLIDKSQYPTSLTYVHTASLYIANNKMPAFKVRMRLLAVDSTNGFKPGNDLIQEQIITKSSIKRGWLEFPLPELPQVEQNAFYLTFEWIIDKADRAFIAEEWLRFEELYPDQVKYDTVIVDGKDVVSKTHSEMVAGTAF
ncbi:MAG: carboxypeptidase-like regulatory domain-containing protein, partial [Bacteroidota bacterium]